MGTGRLATPHVRSAGPGYNTETQITIMDQHFKHKRIVNLFLDSAYAPDTECLLAPVAVVLEKSCPLLKNATESAIFSIFLIFF